MHPNEALITRFYSAFQQHDPAGMIACYHPEVTFSDAVFANLHGERVGQMWQMLAERGKDLQLTFDNVRADDNTGSAHWEARYTFSTTGRKVHNIIEARFRFRDGKIIDHRDHFSFWRWSRQALGLPGLLLGWTSLLRGLVRTQSGRALDAYIARRG